MPTTTHVMRRRPPLRAVGLAALLAVVGILLVLLSVLSEVRWLSVAGALVIVGALAMYVAAWRAARRSDVTVELNADGYRLLGDEIDDAGSWENVTRVTLGGAQLVLHHRDGGVTRLVAPRGSTADLEKLAADIARHLDAHRGYGQSGETT